jgi:hypothetical protein
MTTGALIKFGNMGRENLKPNADLLQQLFAARRSAGQNEW